jgi:hypothetical protein
MTGRFRDGYISGESMQATSVSDVANGHFDVALFASSWDSRCLCVTGSSGLRAERAIVLLFTQKDSLGFRLKHDEQLLSYVKRAATEVALIREASSALDQIRRSIMATVREALQAAGRPLRIFVDLSTCPRFYALDLLATCIKRGIAERVSIFYAEGKYPEEKTAADQYELFTAGGWNAAPIPALRGEWDPNKRRSYLVSIGFEGAKTLRLISRAEPDHVSVLFPDPGVYPEYVERTRKNNEQLFRSYAIRENQIVRAPAGDAIAAWRGLTEAALEKESRDNVYYVCCGTKPHSVALGLRALAAGYAAVLYIVPDRHKVVDTTPKGVYWRFDVQDVTAISERVLAAPRSLSGL